MANSKKEMTTALEAKEAELSKRTQELESEGVKNREMADELAALEQSHAQLQKKSKELADLLTDKVKAAERAVQTSENDQKATAAKIAELVKSSLEQDTLIESLRANIKEQTQTAAKSDQEAKSRLREQNQNLAAVNKTLTTEKKQSAELKNQLEKLSAETAKLREEINSKEDTHALALSKLSETIEAQDKQLKTQESQITNLNEGNDKGSLTIVHLTEQLNRHQLRAAALQKESAAANADIEQKSNIIAALKKILRKLKKISPSS